MEFLGTEREKGVVSVDRMGCSGMGLALENLWHSWTHVTRAIQKGFPLRNGLAVREPLGVAEKEVGAWGGG